MKKSLFLMLLMLFLLITGCEEVTTKSANTNIDNMKESEPAENPQEAKLEETTDFANVDSQNKEEVANDRMENLESSKEQVQISEIITKYKELLNISNDYDEISTEESNEASGNKYYTVNYYNTATNESSWFSADIYGNLMQYGKYSEDEYKKGTNLKSDEAKEKVRDTLFNLYGEAANEFIISDSSNRTSLDATSYFINVTRVVNGIKVPTDRISFEVGKKTKNILSIYVDTATNYDFSDTSKFEDLDGIADKNKAFAEFVKSNNLYKGLLKIDKNENIKIYSDNSFIPVYSFIQRQVPVEAKTLKPYFDDIGSNNMYYRDGAKGDTKDEAIDSTELTPAEQEHIDIINSQFTIADAEAKARELFELADFKLSYSNFSSYQNTKGYNKWILSFTNAKEDKGVYVWLLANDLSLLNYSTYDEGNKGELEASDYLNIANDFAVTKAGLDLSKLIISTRSENKQAGNYYTVEYFRKLDENKILYNDKISININKKTGKVETFNKSWTYNYNSESPQFEITSEQAYERLKDIFGFELYYLRNGNSKNSSLKPFYSLNTEKLGFSNIFIISGENGQALDINGKELYTNSVVEYSDIDTAKKPEIIENLMENNIGFPGGKLEPKKPISQIELFRILASENFYRGDPMNASEDEVYSALEYRNLLDGEAKNPEKIVTNRDYAKYVSRYLNYNDIAKISDIFKDRFTDIDSTDPDYGYLVLAKEKKLIELENENLLEPDKEIDRETALYYFYNLKTNY